MEKVIQFILNDSLVETGDPPGAVALDNLRERAVLKGTKESCREGDCGACMVLLGELRGGPVRYRAVNSCLLPLGDVAGRHLVTIEGLNNEGLSPVQQALVDEGAIQCGFCTPGFVVSLTGFLLNSEGFEAGDALEAIGGNICRCTGHIPFRRVAQVLSERFKNAVDPGEDRVAALVREKVLPGYFPGIAKQLEGLCTVPLPARGDEPVIVSGGTDLFVQEPHAMLEGSLRFLGREEGLTDIRSEEGTLYVGAGTTVEELIATPLLEDIIPNRARHLGLISSMPIRARATVGGNIVNASPIGDLTIMFLALGAVLGLSGAAGDRTVPLREFFRGYKRLDLEAGEIVEWVCVPKRFRGGLFNFERVSKRTHLDIASVNTAISLTMKGEVVEEAGISAGGVAPVPLFLSRASQALVGKPLTAATILETARIADDEISPIDDVRGTAAYRRLLLDRLIRAHFITLFPDRGFEDELL